MKVAIVHDYIKEYGGAERVLETLHEIFPDAPVFTSAYIPEFLGPHKKRFQNWDIRTSWLQNIPFKHKLISPFRLIAPWVFGQFDLSAYDVVIVSATGAYCPNYVRTRIKNQESRIKGKEGKALHICYCHTPPRYLYGYATARDWKSNKLLVVLGSVVNHFLRIADYYASKNVDFYIANSEEVAGRIKKFYRRESTVIYPPVEIENFKNKKSTKPQNLSPKTYYLTGGRLARAKHTDLIVRACREQNLPLKIFGRGFAGYEEELESRIKKQELRTEFLGEVTDEEKYELMQNAKAFIFAGEDEDFGIVPVEAMSTGLPVIAYKSGGVKETIIEGKTGIFFEELTVDSLKKAIQKFEKMKIDQEDCRKQAERFSKQRFKNIISDFINSKSKIINSK